MRAGESLRPTAALTNSDRDDLGAHYVCPTEFLGEAEGDAGAHGCADDRHLSLDALRSTLHADVQSFEQALGSVTLSQAAMKLGYKLESFARENRCRRSVQGNTWAVPEGMGANHR